MLAPVRDDSGMLLRSLVDADGSYLGSVGG